jgi:hypothetical protein
MISDDMWQAHRVLPMIRAYLEANFPGIEVIPETSFPMGSAAIDRDETADIFLWEQSSIPQSKVRESGLRQWIEAASHLDTAASAAQDPMADHAHTEAN